jgi:hypothetical protein
MIDPSLPLNVATAPLFATKARQYALERVQAPGKGGGIHPRRHLVGAPRMARGKGSRYGGAEVPATAVPGGIV